MSGRDDEKPDVNIESEQEEDESDDDDDHIELELSLYGLCKRINRAKSPTVKNNLLCKLIKTCIELKRADLVDWLHVNSNEMSDDDNFDSVELFENLI